MIGSEKGSDSIAGIAMVTLERDNRAPAALPKHEERTTRR